MNNSTRFPAAFIGIGNTIAGNDGAGIVAIERLEQELYPKERARCLITTLDGDMFGITEYLDAAAKFIFIDAVIGTSPGELRHFLSTENHPLSGSFHQTDIRAVMTTLHAMNYLSPFPPWEVHGIVISQPDRLQVGLDPVIDRAVNQLVSNLVHEFRKDGMFEQSDTP